VRGRRTCQAKRPAQLSLPMHFDHLQSSLSAPLPRLDDEEEEEEREDGKKAPAPVAMMIARKFLEQRKIFLWGAVTDETAKDITEKLLYL